jgi:hypothetical protein
MALPVKEYEHLLLAPNCETKFRDLSTRLRIKVYLGDRYMDFLQIEKKFDEEISFCHSNRYPARRISI